MNRRRVSLPATTFLMYLLLGMNLVSVVFSDGMELKEDTDFSKTTTSHRKTLRLSPGVKLRDGDMEEEISLSRSSSSSSFVHRKMLLRLSPPPLGKVEPDRIGERCKRTDIVVNQAPTEPMPNGIPGYTVEITNECMSGCKISRIHVSCGWFSSAKLINPRVFKRIHYDDCLVNNGKPLPYGSTISFHYANTFPYPLSVAFVTCS